MKVLLSLICRNYDIQKGQILIDGIDIRKIKIASLRKHFGQMLQDVFLFAGDIKSNIRLNDTSISDQAVVEAAKYVNAHPFISQLEGGYDHQVIERGAAFSAGQRQLLSFARTLAFQPSVLILDEATANIDTETEALIQDALGKLMEGRTTIIVAHRLSTPFSFYLQSFPASGSFQMTQFFTSGGQNIGASASVLPMNIQD